jgi:hypothetical protein
MSKALSTLIEDVLPDVIGCPYPLVEKAVREVLQDFCGASQIVNRAVLATSTTSVDVAYALDNYEICEVLRLIIDGEEFKPIRVEPVDVLDELDDIEETSKKYWYPVAGGKITLTPFTVAPTEIRLIVAFKPTMLVDTVEDTFYDDWRDTIASGVKSKLMLMSKKTWSDQNLGAYFKNEYRDGKWAATIKVINSLERNSVTHPSGSL